MDTWASHQRNHRSSYRHHAPCRQQFYQREGRFQTCTISLGLSTCDSFQRRIQQRDCDITVRIPFRRQAHTWGLGDCYPLACSQLGKIQSHVNCCKAEIRRTILLSRKQGILASYLPKNTLNSKTTHCIHIVRQVDFLQCWTVFKTTCLGHSLSYLRFLQIYIIAVNNRFPFLFIIIQ